MKYQEIVHIDFGCPVLVS